MNHSPDTKEFFVAGGTLRPDAPSYVERPADEALYRLALSGDFCYVLTPRQMGKSSLMVRTAQRLRGQGVHPAIVDLTRIGTEVDADQWYLGIIGMLKSHLKLDVDPSKWWQEQASVGLVQRFITFLSDIVLVQDSAPIVIFVDEIDSTLSLSFTDDFFVAIRSIYNARSTEAAYRRLTFVLLGVATPADLIKDQAKPPFDIGQRIELQEFSSTEAQPFEYGLRAAGVKEEKAVLGRIMYWTHGHPYLTQKLCRAVAESVVQDKPIETVDRCVDDLFLSEEARKEINLRSVHNSISTNPRRDHLLALYRKIYRGTRVAEDRCSIDQNHLRLSGLVRVRQGAFEVCNEIYRHVFNQAWVKANLQVDPERLHRTGSVVLVALMFLVVTTLVVALGGEIRDNWRPLWFDIFPPAQVRLESIPPASATLPPPTTPSEVVPAPATTSQTPPPATTPPPIPTTLIPTPFPKPTATPPPVVTQVRPRDGMRMILVPAGVFTMGSTDLEADLAVQACRNSPGESECSREDYHDELPAFSLSLGAFWIDETEVRYDQYQQCVAAGVCPSPNTYNTSSNLPATGVTWYGAAAYCSWVGGRLPTEAEWEYAARGPNGMNYPWGDIFDPEQLNYCDTNCEELYHDDRNDGYVEVAPVGAYPAGGSWCGALDMAGNVWEWTSTLARSYPYTNDDGREDPASSGNRVARGGGWASAFWQGARSASRESWDPTTTGPDKGFRCAASPGTVLPEPGSWSTLYFLGPDKAYYVPVNRVVPDSEQPPRQVLEAMITGPCWDSLQSPLPPETKVNYVDPHGQILYVDLDRRFQEPGAGFEETMALVWALTESGDTKQVQLLVNGSPVGLPGTSPGPITRPQYINSENPYNLTADKSIALTLYFATPDGLYLFPVVRRVALTEGVARAAIDEMIRGPSKGSPAVAALPAGTVILAIERVENTIVVDFNSAFLAAPNPELAVNAVVLAMTSLTADSPAGVDSVRISVEGADLGSYWGSAYAGSLYRPVLNPESCPLQGPVAQPRVISRLEWEAALPGEYAPQHPRYITVLHVGEPFSDRSAPRTLEYLRQLQQYAKSHKDVDLAGYAWVDINYHFIVDLRGAIYEGRPVEKRGNADSFDCSSHIMIGVLGDYNTQAPSLTQLNALATLVAWLKQKYVISPADIRGHRDYASGVTSPGDKLYPYIETIRVALDQ